MVAFPVLFLLGVLFLRGRVEGQYATIEKLKSDALKWNGTLTCAKWDCNCTFNHQHGCCCAAKEMYQIEDDIFTRIKSLLLSIVTLNSRVQALTGGIKVAFKATMDPNIAKKNNEGDDLCFGSFSTDVPIPYSIISLNSGNGYNPSMGVFTAPLAGVYVFSFTIHSAVKTGGRLYHKVQMMKNGKSCVSVWEDNREDKQDSGTQVVVLELQQGDQVYLILMSGRKLCTYMQYNIFSGFILYPYIDV